MTRETTPITPSQIRAGRALLGWSQDELAKRANVSLSTVRDFENERRSGDLGSIKAIRQALNNNQVEFLASEGDFGPGVRLIAKAPNVLRLPTMRGRWAALIIPVEWRGRVIEIFVSHEALDDLGGFQESRPSEDYIALFNLHRATILLAAGKAIDAGRVTPDQRVHLQSNDFSL